MANIRLTMRKIREVLRLHFECGRTHREIAQAIGTSTSTVWQYLHRVKLAGLEWPLPAQLASDDAALEARLYPPPAPRALPRGMPHWPTVHREIGKPGVTLDLLWQEYRAQHPDGYGYSWFCRAYQEWAQRLPVTMRQTHMPGQKLFVDYSGKKLGIINPDTGEIREAELFVAALGVSGYTFAELTWTQKLPDWIGSHVRAFAFYNGVVEILVPDNLKSGVLKANFYEPQINETYQEMARHYSTAIIPARPRKPRDKPKAELSVLLVQRWILARLRNQRFFNLDEANRAVAVLLVDLNNRPFKKLPGSRRSVFEEIDRPALRPLPDMPYQYADWIVARVGPDYHVEVDQHYYSVSYRFAREQVDVRVTSNTVEILHRGQRIAAHGKSARRRFHTTVDAHMPPEHQAVVKGCDPQRLGNWAADIGPHTSAVIQHLLGARKHPQQAYRACLGVLRMGKDYGRERLEAACRRAIDLKAPNYKFSAMVSHYLFDAEFCNVASGWEKGQIEKNVQDSRHRLWQKVPTFGSLAALNDWLADQCVLLWQQTRHPEQDMTIWDAWSAERPHLMPVGQPFDGFVEHTKRVSPTCLVNFERNRYSVPASFANRPVSLRVYAARLVFVAEGQVIAEHERCINRSHDHGETIYDWRHYLAVLQRKPGALRNGAPFAEFPAGFRKLQGVLLKRPGGDREMVEILALVLLHDEQMVLTAVELAFEAGAPNKQTVLNILSRLLDSPPVPPLQTPQAFALTVEPQANVSRYDRLRGREDNHAA